MVLTSSGSRRVLGVAVMGEMEFAEIAGRQDQNRAGQIGGGIVEPALAEGGAVDTFVQRRKEENQQAAINHKRRYQPRPERDRQNKRRQGTQHHNMTDPANQALCIGARVQRVQCFRIEPIGEDIIHVQRRTLRRARLGYRAPDR